MVTPKRADSPISLSHLRSIQVLAALFLLYLILLVGFEIPLVLRAGLGLDSPDEVLDPPTTDKEKENAAANASVNDVWPRKFNHVSSLAFGYNVSTTDLHTVARDAFLNGKKLLADLESGKLAVEVETNAAKDKEHHHDEPCPNSLTLSGEEFSRNNLMLIPCGLALGSHITVVGRPKMAAEASKSALFKRGRGKDNSATEFVVELQGLNTVDGEAPPKILHFNPRIKGDWSGRPVIELNTCYRMQWGSGLRCVGWTSKADEDTVDGQAKCEKWIRNDDNGTEAAKTTWWLKRIIGKTKKVTVDWPFPFVENKFFVLTIIAGLEGYHINVDGRHIASFPYRPGFTLEDATGLFLDGDVDVHSVLAASLPTSHPNTAPEKHLEFSDKWKAPNVMTGPVELFIGILSAGNHFAERMAVRKSWMQYPSVQSSNVVARFFVAMHARNEVNVELMKEAEFFGDIVMVPYMDHYDLVVVKTVAICEYGVRSMSAKYIMKCDDDTFVRIDAVMMEVNKINSSSSFYIGNINYHHRPLRHGKWAVGYEEWPELAYPPYANGPGYLISSDLAQYIVTEYEKHRLRLFKMEDVSMGVWVKKYNSSRPVEYVHSYRFCQFGCVEGYYTAHYQSPRQMTCLWGKLLRFQKPYCCNMR